MGIAVIVVVFVRLLVVSCVLPLGVAACNLNDNTTINDNPQKSGSSSSMVLNLASIELIIPEFNKTITLPVLVSLPAEVIDMVKGERKKYTPEYISIGVSAAGALIASLAPYIIWAYFKAKTEISMFHFVITAGSLLKQANGYREEGNIIDLYNTLNRFSSLVGETIPCHPDYLDTLAKKRSVYRKKLSAVMSELRSIKPDVYRRVTELNKAYYHSQSADSTNQKITSDLETSQLYPTGRSASRASSRHNNLFSRHSDSFQTVSSNNMHIEMQFPKISFSLPPPKEETLSRCPIFGPNGVDKSTMDTVLPLDDGRWSRSAEESCSSGNIIKELLQVNNIRQPLPPPVLAELKQHDPSQVADPRPGPAKSMQDEIFDYNSYQQLHICSAMKEEELFEFQDKLSIFPLGWIHTHPSQTCAMSSVDLHTQYAYQIMLPEAIAIVMAPSDTYRQHGTFHLSDPGGVSLIRHCQQLGFHAHEEPSDGSPIYEHCSHVYMNPKLKFEIVDLR